MTFFETLSNAVRAQRESGMRQAQINRLNAKSDAELKAMGISRDRITHHVFRDIIGL